MLFTRPAPTSCRANCVSVTAVNRLMLFKETIAVYCKNYSEQINTLCVQNSEVVILKRVRRNITTVLLSIQVRLCEWTVQTDSYHCEPPRPLSASHAMYRITARGRVSIHWSAKWEVSCRVTCVNPVKQSSSAGWTWQTAFFIPIIFTFTSRSFLHSFSDRMSRARPPFFAPAVCQNCHAPRMKFSSWTTAAWGEDLQCFHPYVTKRRIRNVCLYT